MELLCAEQLVIVDDRWCIYQSSAESLPMIAREIIFLPESAGAGKRLAH
jgi:hypothetical protein